MSQANEPSLYVVCINNEGYPASLETRKVYRRLPDPKAAQHRLVRIVDESGEDYLYPEERFVAIDLPLRAVEAFSAAA